jgi:hypothetical protein
MSRPDLLLYGDNADNVAAKALAAVDMYNNAKDGASDEALTSDLTLLKAAAPIAALLAVARPQKWLAPALDLL